MLKILLIVALAFLSGCIAVQKPQTAESQRQALKLIDQGVILLRTGEWDQAEASFRVAAQIAPLAAAIDGLGCVAFMRGDFRLAEQDFIQAYQTDQHYSRSLGNLALLYEKQGLIEKAGEIYEAAVAKNPQSYEIRNNYAVFLRRNGKESEARLELNRAQALARHPLVEFNLAQLNRS